MDDITLSRLINRLLDQEEREVRNNREIDECFKSMRATSERVEQQLSNAYKNSEMWQGLYEKTQKQLDELKGK